MPEHKPSLQDQLTKYQQAYEAEYTVTDDDAALSEAKHILRTGIVDAARSIVHLTSHSESEQVRLNAAKYLLDRTVGVSASDDDPIDNLVKALTAQTPINP